MDGYMMKITGSPLQGSDFGDDSGLSDRDRNKLQELLNRLAVRAEQLGLRVNVT